MSIIENIFPGQKPDIVIYDLDETLIRHDSDLGWLFWLFRKKRWLQAFREFQRMAVIAFSHQNGTLSSQEYIKFYNGRMKNYYPKDYKNDVVQFFQEQGYKLFYKDALSLFSQMKEMKIPIGIMTAQTQEMAAPFAEFVGADFLLGNKFSATEDGKYGLPEKPYIFGDGKRFHACRFLKERNIPIENAVFISDSLNDLPLLSEVGYPIVVNPGRKLKKKAHEGKWPILIFK